MATVPSSSPYNPYPSRSSLRSPRSSFQFAPPSRQNTPSQLVSSVYRQTREQNAEPTTTPSTQVGPTLRRSVYIGSRTSQSVQNHLQRIERSRSREGLNEASTSRAPHTFSPRSRSSSPSPTLPRTNTRFFSQERELLERLQIIEHCLEKGLNTLDECNTLEQTLDSSLSLIQSYRLPQYTARLKQSKELLSAVKASLELSPPNPPASVESSCLTEKFDEGSIKEDTDSLLIGSIKVPSEADVENARICGTHLLYPIQELPVPESPVSMDQAVISIFEKASELQIEIPNLREKLLAELRIPTLKPKISRSLRKIVHTLSQHEERAKRTGDANLIEKVNAKWVEYLPALEIGSGDCSDPLSTQIESCYKNLTSAPATSFEEKLQISVREFRDEIFNSSCSQYMRDSGKYFDQASALPFFRAKLEKRFALSPTTNTHFEQFCTRCGYGDHIQGVRQAFKRQYTAKNLLQYLCREENGKAVLSRKDIIDFLHKKTSLPKEEIERIASGLDEDYMPTGHVLSKESLAMMVVKNLDKPMLI